MSTGVRFTFSNSPAVFSFMGHANNFGSVTYQLYGHEIRIQGLVQNDSILDKKKREGRGGGRGEREKYRGDRAECRGER